jgi:cyclomaltodextrinase / maltogenic alpha-amylase / neopullulanase
VADQSREFDSAPPDWVRDAVFYQVFPDRFASSGRVPKPGPYEPWDAPPSVHGFKGGDLLGVVDRLDYLDDLGVTALYLNPIFASAANHRYHTYDYLAVDPLLGGTDALRELLDAAHRRGMRVVLDGVFNHTGRGFWPFHHILEAGASSPYRDWFHLNQEMLARGERIRAYPEDLRTASPSADEGAVLARGHSFDSLGYRAWWDLPALPKLNTGNPIVREYLLGVGEHWVRFGADGWRLDVPEEIDDAAFWSEFRSRVRSVNPEAYLLGEVWRVAPGWVAGGPFDGLMNYPLMWAIVGLAAGDHLDLAVAAEQAHVGAHLHPLDGPAFALRLEEIQAAYPASATAAHLNLVGSHDTPRIATLCSDDEAAVRLAMLLLMTLPGAPCIYYGDEIGLAGHADPGCRAAFPWDESRWNGGTRDFVRRAVALRRDEAALRGDGCRILGARESACAIERSHAPATLVVAVNAGRGPIDLAVEVAAGSTLVPALGTGADAADASAERHADGGWSLRLAPRTGAVWRAERGGLP